MLLGGAEAQQHLHVAGVRGVAVAHLGGDQRAAHALGQRGVLDVGEPRALDAAADLGAAGQEEVPEALRARLRLQLLDGGVHDPRVRAREELAVVGLLAGRNLALDERAQALQQLARAGGVLKVHRRD